MSDSERTPSVELDGPRLDEVKARTLADYRPQHKYDCGRKKCQRCGTNHSRPQDHLFQRGGACTCGLDTLLSAAALEHGRSSATVEQLKAHWFTQGGHAEFGPIAGENADELISSILAAVRAESPALGGERSPQSEAVEQARREVIEDWSEAANYAHPVWSDRRRPDFVAMVDVLIAAVRQAERSSEPAGITTGTEAK